MSAHIPQAILAKCPKLKGLNLISRGKVRDSYDLPKHRRLMLVVATDRISIFDFVLNMMVPLKGAILNAFNIFWRLQFGGEFKHDLVAYGPRIDRYLPKHLRGDPELQKRAIVVRKCSMIPVEGIVRGYLLGSAWEAYQKTSPHVICGIPFPDGLKEGSEIAPVFTPTTKAVVGHDEHISAADVETKFPGFGDKCKALYFAASRHAYSRGVIIADTKFEGSLREICDEWLTPDSSRFWLRSDYEKFLAGGKLPASLDKQRARNLGKKMFIDKTKNGRKRDPDNPRDLAYVHACRFPESEPRMLTSTYRYAFYAIIGMKIEDFWQTVMKIPIKRRRARVEVLTGSLSDLPQTEKGIALLAQNANVRARAMSCDRNSPELAAAVPELALADFVIAAAGKSARLPGAVKSLLCSAGHPYVPVYGVGLKGDSELADLAAKLAISEIPGQPVIMESPGRPYSGEGGFLKACLDALQKEPLPMDIERKPVVLIKDFDPELKPVARKTKRRSDWGLGHGSFGT